MRTPLFPLPLEPETYVVVQITDGLANLDAIHQPAKKRKYPPTLANRDGYTRSFTRSIEDGFVPAEWVAACDPNLVGTIYLHAGSLAKAPICPDCLATAREREPKAKQAQGTPRAAPEHSVSTQAARPAVPSRSLTADKDAA